jgi:phospholipase/carboxylesterase
MNDVVRVRLREDAPAGARLEPGLRRLELGGVRDGVLYVPAGDPAPSRLVVMLHGAGSSGAKTLLPALRAAADAARLVLLAPDSRGPTWDVLLGGYGPDVAFLEAALDDVLPRMPDPSAEVVLAGFSDGASYALSLGLGNGALFGRLVAFSPGFVAAAAHRGRPSVFVSHGTEDRVLPIERCSRRIVPRLRAEGYEVEYVEFAGGHTVPEDVARRAAVWAVGEAGGPAG